MSDNAIGNTFDDLIDRATLAFMRWQKRYGNGIPQQPSRTCSYVNGDGEIVLKNVRGELARYYVRTTYGLPYESDRGRLVRLRY